MDKDIELQKIEVFDGYLQTKINARYSFLVAEVVGIIILIATLFYEGIFDINGNRTIGLVVFTVILLIASYFLINHRNDIKKVHSEYLSLTYNLIVKVEKGEALPSLSELKELASKKNKI